MRNEARDLIFFPSRAPELLSKSAAERDHWLMEETRRARARTLRHGLANVRNWVALRLGIGAAAERDNVVSVNERASGERRRGGTRRVA